MDTDLTGVATVLIDKHFRSFCYTITLNRASNTPTTAAHIHIGDVGEPGPIVIPLAAPPAGGTKSAGCGTASSDLLRDIVNRPDDYYVNVHTEGHPAGAIRGQLVLTSSPKHGGHDGGPTLVCGSGRGA